MYSRFCTFHCIHNNSNCHTIHSVYICKSSEACVSKCPFLYLWYFPVGLLFTRLPVFILSFCVYSYQAAKYREGVVKFSFIPQHCSVWSSCWFIVTVLKTCSSVSAFCCAFKYQRTCQRTYERLSLQLLKCMYYLEMKISFIIEFWNAIHFH